MPNPAPSSAPMAQVTAPRKSRRLTARSSLIYPLPMAAGSAQGLALGCPGGNPLDHPLQLFLIELSEVGLAGGLLLHQQAALRIAGHHRRPAGAALQQGLVTGDVEALDAALPVAGGAATLQQFPDGSLIGQLQSFRIQRGVLGDLRALR